MLYCLNAETDFWQFLLTVFSFIVPLAHTRFCSLHYYNMTINKHKTIPEVRIESHVVSFFVSLLWCSDLIWELIGVFKGELSRKPFLGLQSFSEYYLWISRSVPCKPCFLLCFSCCHRTLGLSWKIEGLVYSTREACHPLRNQNWKRTCSPRLPLSRE